MRALRTFGAAALVVGLVACGSGESVPQSTPTTTTAVPTASGPDLSAVEFTDQTADAAVRVDVRDNSFNAKYIEVKAGTPVTFANRGRNQHNVLPVEGGAFAQVDAEDLEPGEEQTITFAKPGDYAYYCSLHGTKTKGMVGALRVVS